VLKRSHNGSKGTGHNCEAEKRAACQAYKYFRGSDLRFESLQLQSRSAAQFIGRRSTSLCKTVALTLTQNDGGCDFKVLDNAYDDLLFCF
jgi:hypothetical protein